MVDKGKVEKIFRDVLGIKKIIQNEKKTSQRSPA